MKKKGFIFGLVIFFACAGSAFADSGADHGMKGGHGAGLDQYKVHFKTLDKDGSGGLNWEEYSTHFTGSKKEVFNALDTDKDGSISKEEWHAFKSAHGMAGHPHGKKYHKTDMPDPAAYNAHFPDIDTDGNGTVTMKEFKTYFPEGKEDVFNAVDLDKSSGISHEEWHEFKSAHGMKDHN